VGLDGPPRDEHPLGDLGVGEALGDQADDLELGGGERVPARGRPPPAAGDAAPRPAPSQGSVDARQVARRAAALVGRARLLEQLAGAVAGRGRVLRGAGRLQRAAGAAQEGHRGEQRLRVGLQPAARLQRAGLEAAGAGVGRGDPLQLGDHSRALASCPAPAASHASSGPRIGSNVAAPAPIAPSVPAIVSSAAAASPVAS
jgi:hypothetical protein